MKAKTILSVLLILSVAALLFFLNTGGIRSEFLSFFSKLTGSPSSASTEVSSAGSAAEGKASQSTAAVTPSANAKEAPPATAPETVSPTADVSDCYGYSQLSQSEKVVYNQLLSGFDKMSSDISITPVPISTLKKVYNYVIGDNPRLFWVDISGYTYYYYNDQANRVVQPYLIAPSQKDAMVAAADAAASQVLSQLSSGMSDYSKAIVLHDSLVNAVTYSDAGGMSHNLYGALVEHKAVCDGYARAYQYLCKKVGIFALVAEGTAQSGGTSGGHAWNVIRMGTEYYHMDVTWDDSDSANLPGYVSYSYFGLTTRAITRDHTVDQTASYPIPTATATQYNYFVKEGLLFDTYEGAKSAIEAQVKKAGPSKNPYIRLQFSTADAYAKASENISDDAYNAIMALNPSLQYRVTKLSYMLDDSVNTAVLVLQYGK